MNLPPYGELSPEAKEYFRQLGEFVDGVLIPIDIYKEFANYPGETAQKEIVVEDLQLLEKMTPYARSAVQYLGYLPQDFKFSIMVNGGTRPIKILMPSNKTVYIKLAEPSVIILRELYKRIGILKAPYHAATDGIVTIEQGIFGMHEFQLPKHLEPCHFLAGYKEAIIALDVCRFFGGFGDLAKLDNTIIQLQGKAIGAIIPIDFNVPERYTINIQEITKQQRCSRFQITAQQHSSIYERYELQLWHRLRREQYWFERLLIVMETMEEFVDIVAYIRANYRQLQRKYGGNHV